MTSAPSSVGAARAPGVFDAMGTVVSVRLGARVRADDPDRTRCADDAGAADDARAADAADAAAGIAREPFERWDRLCSLYRADSELARVARGELALAATSEPVRDAYERAMVWSSATDGVFTPHRGDGVLDLDGVVKALAIDDAGRALDAAGFGDWCIDAGGDVLVRGEPWRGAIVDPADRAGLVASVVLSGDRRAVATSGSAERGDHIWTPTDAGPSPIAQASVVASGIELADVLATTIVAGGLEALDRVTARWPVDALVVLRDGSLLATPGWPSS